MRLRQIAVSSIQSSTWSGWSKIWFIRESGSLENALKRSESSKQLLKGASMYCMWSAKRSWTWRRNAIHIKSNKELTSARSLTCLPRVTRLNSISTIMTSKSRRKFLITLHNQWLYLPKKKAWVTYGVAIAIRLIWKAPTVYLKLMSPLLEARKHRNRIFSALFTFQMNRSAISNLEMTS